MPCHLYRRARGGRVVIVKRKVTEQNARWLCYALCESVYSIAATIRPSTRRREKRPTSTIKGAKPEMMRSLRSTRLVTKPSHLNGRRSPSHDAAEAPRPPDKWLANTTATIYTCFDFAGSLHTRHWTFRSFPRVVMMMMMMLLLATTHTIQRDQASPGGAPPPLSPAPLAHSLDHSGPHTTALLRTEAMEPQHVARPCLWYAEGKVDHKITERFHGAAVGGGKRPPP